MFICYLDESGYTGPNGWATQRVLIVGGVLVNTYRAPKTRRDWLALLAELAEMAGQPLDELKGRELFRGSGAWGSCDHLTRTAARSKVLTWLAERGHKVVVSGVQYDRLHDATNLCTQAHALHPYVAAGVHIGLMVQRSQHASTDRTLNKNATLLMFDRQAGTHEQQLARLLATPPAWAIDFVSGRCSEKDTLPVILDTAYFVDSKHASFIQIADFVSYMIQRKASLDAGSHPSFDGEKGVLEDVWTGIEPLLIAKTHRFPAGQRPFARFMEAVSPPALVG